jgi:alpha-L-fucosidase
MSNLLCSFYIADGGSSGCAVADLSALPDHVFSLRDAYPMNYSVAPPCRNVSAHAYCTQFAAGSGADSPAFAHSAGTCYALGRLADAAVAPLPAAVLGQAAAGHGGLQLVYGGGDSTGLAAPRELVYNLLCDPTAAPDAAPDELVEPVAGEGGKGERYEVTWRTPHACTAPAPASRCPAPARALPPAPDAKMLAYVEKEVGALVCWNMATADGTQGCPPHHVPGIATWERASGMPATEAALDAATEGWAASIAAFGGRYATLVAKHVCGFAIWPTNASLPAAGGPGGRAAPFAYAYHSSLDVVGSFARACARRGIGLGIYYSVNANEYLNYAGGVRGAATLAPGQVAVTQAEYASLVLQQLAELWSRYGDLAEIWFDGGYDQVGLVNATRSLLRKLQPGVPVFNGCGLVPNAVGWIGSESGHAAAPVWDSADSCADIGTNGAPLGSAMFLPYEVDLTLQNADTWFYEEGRGYRSLPEMAAIYHDSVGRGGNMLLNVAPPPNGTLPPAAVARYAQLGAFVSACYGPANARAVAAGEGYAFELELDEAAWGSSAVDRFVVKEDLKGGQRILQFVVEAVLQPPGPPGAGGAAGAEGAGEVVSVYNGTAAGRTLVHLLPTPLARVALLRLRVLRSRGVPSLRAFSAPAPAACVVGAPPGGCSTAPNVAYDGPWLERHAPGSGFNTEALCCARCGATQGCAVFNLHANTTCELLAAQTGTYAEAGGVSGSWQ